MNHRVAAYVGLGANLGDTVATLRAALAGLGALPGTRLVRTSRFYRTPAWGVEAQPDFVNAVAALDTVLPPRELLEHLFAIERQHGRDRSREQRWGPRRLDLDLLLYADALVDEPGLQVPHPQLHRRGFVLVPLLEIAPDLEIPGHGRVRNAVSALEPAEVADISALSVDNASP